MEIGIGSRLYERFDSQFAELANELRRSPGETAEERLEHWLKRHGWERRIAQLGDDPALHGFVVNALKKLALPRASGATAETVETARRREIMERAAGSGMYGDLFADQYIGWPAGKLCAALPCEQYWVESLGRMVAREDLAGDLASVSELRRSSSAELAAIEQSAIPYRHELAIFDELLRQRGQPTPCAGESVPA